VSRASLDIWNRKKCLAPSGIEIAGNPARSLVIVTILTELPLVLSKIVRKLKGGGEEKVGTEERIILDVINVYYVNQSTGKSSNGSSSMSFCL